MHNQIIIHKYNSFTFGKCVGSSHHRTASRLPEGLATTSCTLPDDREDFEHRGGDNAQRASQTLGCNGLGCADPVIDPFVNHGAGKHRPEILRHRPALDPLEVPLKGARAMLLDLCGGDGAEGHASESTSRD
jgi:hypothetical protein